MIVMQGRKSVLDDKIILGEITLYIQAKYPATLVHGACLHRLTLA